MKNVCRSVVCNYQVLKSFPMTNHRIVMQNTPFNVQSNFRCMSHLIQIDVFNQHVIKYLTRIGN